MNDFGIVVAVLFFGLASVVGVYAVDRRRPVLAVGMAMLALASLGLVYFSMLFMFGT